MDTTLVSIELLRVLTASYNPHFDRARLWVDSREQHP